MPGTEIVLSTQKRTESMEQVSGDAASLHLFMKYKTKQTFSKIPGQRERPSLNSLNHCSLNSNLIPSVGLKNIYCQYYANILVAATHLLCLLFYFFIPHISDIIQYLPLSMTYFTKHNSL